MKYVHFSTHFSVKENLIKALNYMNFLPFFMSGFHKTELNRAFGAYA